MSQVSWNDEIHTAIAILKNKIIQHVIYPSLYRQETLDVLDKLIELYENELNNLSEALLDGDELENYNS